MTHDNREGHVMIRPLADRVVVKPNDPEKETASGLVIPDIAQEYPQEGVVLAVGPGRWEHGGYSPTGIAVGDTVLFTRYGATACKVDGEELLVFAAHDILAVLVADSDVTVGVTQ